LNQNQLYLKKSLEILKRKSFLHDLLVKKKKPKDERNKSPPTKKAVSEKTKVPKSLPKDNKKKNTSSERARKTSLIEQNNAISNIDKILNWFQTKSKTSQQDAPIDSSKNKERSDSITDTSDSMTEEEDDSLFDLMDRLDHRGKSKHGDLRIQQQNQSKSGSSETPFITFVPSDQADQFSNQNQGTSLQCRLVARDRATLHLVCEITNSEELSNAIQKNCLIESIFSRSST